MALGCHVAAAWHFAVIFADLNLNFASQSVNLTYFFLLLGINQLMQRLVHADRQASQGWAQHASYGCH